MVHYMDAVTLPLLVQTVFFMRVKVGSKLRLTASTSQVDGNTIRPPRSVVPPGLIISPWIVICELEPAALEGPKGPCHYHYFDHYHYILGLHIGKYCADIGQVGYTAR